MTVAVAAAFLGIVAMQQALAVTVSVSIILVLTTSNMLVTMVKAPATQQKEVLS